MAEPVPEPVQSAGRVMCDGRLGPRVQVRDEGALVRGGGGGVLCGGVVGLGAVRGLRGGLPGLGGVDGLADLADQVGDGAALVRGGGGVLCGGVVGLGGVRSLRGGVPGLGGVDGPLSVNLS